MFSMMAISRTFSSETSRKTAGTLLRPARWAARQRRSPAISSNLRPFRRSSSGWTTPLARIDLASSSSLASSKILLGCRELGSIRSIGTSLVSSVAVAVPSAERSAPSPRHNAFRVMRDYLLRQLKVRCRPFGMHIVKSNGFSVARRLGQANISGNYRSEDLLPVKVAQVGRYGCRQVGPFVVHRQEESFNGKTGIVKATNSGQSVKQFRHSLERVVLTLNWYEQRIG